MSHSIKGNFLQSILKFNNLKKCIFSNLCLTDGFSVSLGVDWDPSMAVVFKTATRSFMIRPLTESEVMAKNLQTPLLHMSFRFC